LVPLRRGRYRLEVAGWRNPHHGILDITVDNKVISPAEGLDWYAETSTSAYTFPSMFFEVEATGNHILRGETSRCHSGALGAKYWICLETLRILPADEPSPVAEETAPSVRLPAPHCERVLRRRCPQAELARAAAEKAAAAATAAAMLTGAGLKFGHHAAWWGAALLLRRLHGSLHRLVPRLRCPCRRPFKS
jgi:hypothetical protein